MEGKAWKARSEKKGGVKTKVSDNGKGCSRRDQTGHHRRPRRCRANRAWRPSLFCIHVPWLQRRRCQGPRAFLPAQFPARSYCQPPVAGAQKIDACGADVASDKRYGKFLGHSTSTTKAKRKVQAGTGIFTLLWMDAHGVSGHADKTSRLLRA